MDPESLLEDEIEQGIGVNEHKCPREGNLVVGSVLVSCLGLLATALLDHEKQQTQGVGYDHHEDVVVEVNGLIRRLLVIALQRHHVSLVTGDADEEQEALNHGVAAKQLQRR